ncbi:16S rRNA (uracil(1498)-N(3))-methyltransferase [Candidatus Azambacteria bacterium]|nr:16S rRNA (uracil(1498)-N(3))-methyltransferase [Candidatus Azambacteria bacterium]
MTERFFISEKIGELQNELVISDSDLIRQIGKVLRKKTGDKIFILDNSGFEFECEIRQASKKLILLKILKKEKNKNEPEVSISLYQSLLKKDKMEFVFEKCAEIGILNFHPMVSEHSVKLSFKSERAEKILKEAAEQSQRGVIPRLFETKKFKNAIGEIGDDSLKIIFHEKEKNAEIFDFLMNNKEKIGKYKEISIFIGPEGGFSESEISLAKEKGFNVLSLGKRVLRAETAAIVASAFFAI